MRPRKSWFKALLSFHPILILTNHHMQPRSRCSIQYQPGKEIQQRDTQRQTAKLQGPTFTHASPESWLSILLMRGTARWHSFRSDGCISVAEPTCWQALKDFGEKNNHKDEFKSGYVTSFEEHKDVLALDQEFWLGFSSRRPLKRAPVFVCLT